MKLVEFLTMVNNFDDATKDNLNKMLYEFDDKSKGSNSDGNNRSIEFCATNSRYPN